MLKATGGTPGDPINRGLLAAGTDLVAVVDGCAPDTDRWLGSLAALMVGPCGTDVAAVGGVIVRADGRIESAGIHVGGQAGSGPVHDGHLLGIDNSGPLGRFLISREVGALSMGCVLLRRDAVLKVGGVHPTLTGIEAAADLGCKLIAAGHRVVWTPVVRAERVGRDVCPDEPGTPATEEFRRRWALHLNRDPFAPAGPALGRHPAVT